MHSSSPPQRRSRTGSFSFRGATLAALLLGSVCCSRNRTEEEETRPPPTITTGETAQLAPATRLPSTGPNADRPVPKPSPGSPDGGIEVVSGERLLERALATGARAIIVNAWASWCGPCRREFPMLVNLGASMKSESVAVVFVSVDEPESHDAALDFAREHGQEGPVFVAERPLGPFKRSLHPDWPGMLPATFLYDEHGRLRFFWGGPVYEEELLPVVEGLLRGEKIDGEQRFGLRPGRDDRR